jgi:transcriptional regulator with XRE-family HTH domain
MRRLRAERGLSQEALAHECGINRTFLSGVERSERSVSIDNIARIARGLKVKAWILLDDSSKPYMCACADKRAVETSLPSVADRCPLSGV